MSTKVQQPTENQPHELSPVINSYFEKLSELQWCMIEKGVLDSDLQALLADMIAEIIQSVSAGILKTLLPDDQCYLAGGQHKKLYDTLSFAALISPSSLEDSLSASISRALNIPCERHFSAKELTQMIGEEIFEKVTSVVSLLTENPQLRPEPAVYVSVKVTDIKKLRHMVSHTASYLKRCAGKMSHQCVTKEAVPSPHSSKETSESKISEKAAVNEVSLALTRWCAAPEITKADNDVESREEIQIPVRVPEGMIMEETREAIKNSLHCKHIVGEQCTEAETNAQGHQCYRMREQKECDLVNVMNNLRVEGAEPKQCAKEDTAVHCRCEMIAAQPLILTDKLRYLPDEGTPEQRTDTEEKAQSLWPPSTTAGTAAADIVNAVTDHLQHPGAGDDQKCSSPKPDLNVCLLVEKVRDFFASHAPLAKRDAVKAHKDHFFRFVKKELENLIPELREQVDNNTKFFIHLEEPDKSSQKSSPESRSFRKLNTPVLLRTKKKCRPIDFNIIKPVLNEWFDKRTTEEKIKTFSVQLTDLMYDHLQIQRKYPLPTMPPGTSLSDSIISRTFRTKFPFYPEILYVSVEDSVERFLQKILLWLDNEALDESVQSDRISGAMEEIHDVVVRAMTTMEEQESDNLSTSVPAETIVRDFIVLLFTRALKKCKKSKKGAQNSEEVEATIKSLTDTVLQKVTSAESLRILDENKNEITKGMTKELFKKFGSPQKFLNAAVTSEDSSFGDTLLIQLNNVLDAYSSPPKKSKVDKVVSAVRRVFMRPFRSCFKASSHD